MIKVKTIRQWCESNLAPMAWQRIIIRLLPEFRKEGFFLQTIHDESILSADLLDRINRVITEVYQVRLPIQISQSHAH